MAYVRKTATLVEDITDQVTKMRSVAEARYDVDNIALDPSQLTELVEAAHVTAWSEAPELRRTMPPAWRSEPASADLRVYGPNNETTAMIKYSVQGTYNLPATTRYSRREPAIDIKYENLSPSLKSCVDDCAGNAEKLKEIHAKFSTVRNQLVAYMEQHASLNAALTEMPQLEMYVPQKYMQRIRAASEPRAKVQHSNVVALNIDVDALTAAAITHRIATATS